MVTCGKASGIARSISCDAAACVSWWRRTSPRAASMCRASATSSISTCRRVPKITCTGSGEPDVRGAPESRSRWSKTGSIVRSSRSSAICGSKSRCIPCRDWRRKAVWNDPWTSAVLDRHENGRARALPRRAGVRRHERARSDIVGLVARAQHRPVPRPADGRLTVRLLP